MQLVSGILHDASTGREIYDPSTGRILRCSVGGGNVDETFDLVGESSVSFADALSAMQTSSWIHPATYSGAREDGTWQTTDWLTTAVSKRMQLEGYGASVKRIRASVYAGSDQSGIGWEVRYRFSSVADPGAYAWSWFTGASGSATGTTDGSDSYPVEFTGVTGSNTTYLYLVLVLNPYEDRRGLTPDNYSMYFTPLSLQGSNPDIILGF
jgi:hypothetical protein